ncbi:TRAP transporter fused permease subunit [Roseospira marina]|uniref:TRAP transporter fused permease subunit n=1 Tax=Roseospira marina TaxID=140057 RepID=A0A5M6IAH2_9PROT|nr:TRAP transporter fused permease subunit [Roseospira marina]KAA5604719.1 TRAP transporter fused permease subunit [Roseospira marina]MBB4315168.1 TRAP transporter 4TM/12TM fusion protein [Roseospira marina]MBB5088062.1 TRAP transporter 4TM/12TM fusion protein [Roseospira marina]
MGQAPGTASPDDHGHETEVGEVSTIARPLRGPLRHAVFAIGVVTAVTHIYLNTFGTMAELRFAALHFGLFGLMCALLYPLFPARTRATRRVVLGVDVVLGVLCLLTTAYLFLFEDAFYDRGMSFDTWDWIVSGVALLLAMEFARRSSGWLIPILIVLSLSYAILWGPWVDGVFHFSGLSAEVMMMRTYFTGDGLYGPIARISYSYVAMFILFGAFLVRSGAGDFIIDLARCAAGRFVGGPGLVAVFGSGLMGSISGSAVANTMSTGVITIPLMKKAGYPPRFAAGVEAAASTGGQIMPPIMGAGAFIMANYTLVPYVDIVALSVLPALIYFLSVAAFVRVEAIRQGLTAQTAEDGKTLRQVMKEGWHFLLPIGVLIVLLIQGFTPTYAAGISMGAVVVASWLSPNRMGPRAILEALAEGARIATTMAILLVAVGVVVAVIATTGVGNTFSLMINDWAGGQLWILLILIAIASLVLGMGLPVTAAYAVLAPLSAPAINDLLMGDHIVQAIAAGTVPEPMAMTVGMLLPDLAGTLGQPMPLAEAQQVWAQISALPGDFTSGFAGQLVDATTVSMTLLAAHLIIFWLSQDSNVTPPVCLTAFAAGAIAGTKPMATGFTAWKIAKGLYIVPVLFAYTALVTGSWAEQLEIFVFAVLGVYAFAGTFQGCLESPLRWYERLATGIATALLLWPHGTLAIHLTGAAVLAAMVALSWRRKGAAAG